MGRSVPAPAIVVSAAWRLSDSLPGLMFGLALAPHDCLAAGTLHDWSPRDEEQVPRELLGMAWSGDPRRVRVEPIGPEQPEARPADARHGSFSFELAQDPARHLSTRSDEARQIRP
jgi:hypothetical protein